MTKRFPAGIRDTRDLVGRVGSGRLNRRDLLKLFGVSAAAFKVQFLAGCSDSREEAYDYIVVGAGSAGCTLTARLLADSSARVLLIEAGGSNDRAEIKDFTQSFLLTQPGSEVDWAFKSEPQSALMGRQQSYSCGKVLGGSSSINGMVWVRGNPADFDGWAALGCEAGTPRASSRPSRRCLTDPSFERDDGRQCAVTGDRQSRGRSRPFLQRGLQLRESARRRVHAAQRRDGIRQMRSPPS